MVGSHTNHWLRAIKALQISKFGLEIRAREVRAYRRFLSVQSTYPAIIAATF